MFLHGVMNANIEHGDTLGDPQHIENGELMVFDRVIANPPFSLKKWGKELAGKDPYGRYPYGTPPKDAGDLAFVQQHDRLTAVEWSEGCGGSARCVV